MGEGNFHCSAYQLVLPGARSFFSAACRSKKLLSAVVAHPDRRCGRDNDPEVPRFELEYQEDQLRSRSVNVMFYDGSGRYQRFTVQGDSIVEPHRVHRLTTRFVDRENIFLLGEPATAGKKRIIKDNFREQVLAPLLAFLTRFSKSQDVNFVFVHDTEPAPDGVTPNSIQLTPDYDEEILEGIYFDHSLQQRFFIEPIAGKEFGAFSHRVRHARDVYVQKLQCEEGVEDPVAIAELEFKVRQLTHQLETLKSAHANCAKLEQELQAFRQLRTDFEALQRRNQALEAQLKGAGQAPLPPPPNGKRSRKAGSERAQRPSQTSPTTTPEDPPVERAPAFPVLMLGSMDLEQRLERCSFLSVRDSNTWSAYICNARERKGNPHLSNEARARQDPLPLTALRLVQLVVSAQSLEAAITAVDNELRALRFGLKVLKAQPLVRFVVKRFGVRFTGAGTKHDPLSSTIVEGVEKTDASWKRQVAQYPQTT